MISINDTAKKRPEFPGRFQKRSRILNLYNGKKNMRRYKYYLQVLIIRLWFHLYVAIADI